MFTQLDVADHNDSESNSEGSLELSCSYSTGNDVGSGGEASGSQHGVAILYEPRATS